MNRYLKMASATKRIPFIMIKIKWISLLLFFFSFNLSGQVISSRTFSLFDEQTLKGWKPVSAADKNLWSVVDGVIVCNNNGELIKSNSFLQTDAEYEDFEFRCLFRLSGDSGFINSGIQYRSKVIGETVAGYQADIGNGYWGDIYDEHRRGTLVKGDSSTLRHLLFESGWNSYIIRVKGNHHELYINGIKTADYLEKDRTIPSKGIIALQIHGGGIAKMEFKKITITVF